MCTRGFSLLCSRPGAPATRGPNVSRPGLPSGCAGDHVSLAIPWNSSGWGWCLSGFWDISFFANSPWFASLSPWRQPLAERFSRARSSTVSDLSRTPDGAKTKKKKTNMGETDTAEMCIWVWRHFWPLVSVRRYGHVKTVETFTSRISSFFPSNQRPRTIISQPGFIYQFKFPVDILLPSKRVAQQVSGPWDPWESGHVGIFCR